ncbi:DNA-binding PadR family transcriptional regulator [Cytobacillus horneckiae]|uniref:PadR family transcriptional regulator n=1 Tax=Cytobacillus horneckiae TaxID=549687 RepID=A0A2N0ZC03_9BACI|nr:PadR family transcriptional regulator [Cytobacillus horneckiae]MBN6886050.1 PadR family transcriptional regulator [Cytobacillus horneckiae]MCM3176355.1 PadR family transcriptional regulator [Cytobacillus horneckiae]MEC1159167.1 PadR family transcriptional regulator [Cytobacillus horneckiae]MED2940748.1 PadR family transcriptional regulator [Cytobacillus horneckiae]PKG27030.1 PadR family transcriptional regulator [Cytobacillus horneckiae]
MTVKFTILGFLYYKDMHGYEIITEFNNLVQNQWPLNPGQVYSTLERLERDGLVESLGENNKGRIAYRITEKGKEALSDWITTPIKRPLLREELYMKFLLAGNKQLTGLEELINSQKELIIKQILILTDFKKNIDNKNFKKIIYGGLLHLEADLKWLEYIKEEM